MSTHYAHALQRAAADAVQPDGWIDEVYSYLRGRGLTADSEEYGKLLRRLFEISSGQLGPRLTVNGAAKCLYVSRRTLGRWCEAAGLPNPGHMLQFGRVLTAVHFISAMGCSIKRGAGLAGWTDPFSLSNSMLRFTGLRPSAEKAKAPLAVAEMWLQRELAAGTIELRPANRVPCPSCGRHVATPE